MISLKKGAMFGLDARIALAIFGALSIISGAALYSAIEQAKATSTIAEAKELMKSFEQYYLDTGSILPLVSPLVNSGGYVADHAYLVIDKSVSGWKGPYTPLEYGLNNLEHPTGSGFSLFYLKGNVNWTGFTSSAKCDISNPCYAWVAIYDANGIYSESIKKKIDEMVDGSDGANKGNFRWDANRINFKGILVPSLS
jgi:hypothetical protein